MQAIGIQANEVTLASQVAAFRLGTIASYDHPTLGTQFFVYGRAQAAITGAGFAVGESTSNLFRMLTTANTAAGQPCGHGTRVGVAQAPMAANDFGWFQIAGRGSLRTLASAALGTRLNTTATAGALDDDGSVGARVINGIVLGTATGGAEATNADAYLNFPTVGATL